MDDQERIEQEQGIVRIPLDGSYGAGPDAEVTIVTKTEDGKRREAVYTIPYLCIDEKKLQNMCAMNLILGYSVIKSASRAPELKELGL